MKKITFTEKQFKDFVANLTNDNLTGEEKYKLCLKEMDIREE